jgi:hypothetical protein
MACVSANDYTTNWAVIHNQYWVSLTNALSLKQTAGTGIFASSSPVKEIAAF